MCYTKEHLLDLIELQIELINELDTPEPNTFEEERYKGRLEMLEYYQQKYKEIVEEEERK